MNDNDLELSIEDTISLLSRVAPSGDERILADITLVGGQALNFWADHYFGFSTSFVSKDIDLLVDPAYTSQTCSVCGYVSRENRPSQAVFRCQQCGHTEHADLNAAKNILARGLQATAGHAGVVCSG